LKTYEGLFILDAAGKEEVSKELVDKIQKGLGQSLVQLGRAQSSRSERANRSVACGWRVHRQQTGMRMAGASPLTTLQLTTCASGFSSVRAAFPPSRTPICLFTPALPLRVAKCVRFNGASPCDVSISVPNLCMLQWIANLSAQVSRRLSRWPLEEARLIQAFADPGVRVEVREHRMNGRHLGFSIRVFFCIDEADDWFEIANLRDYNVQRVIDFVQEATTFVSGKSGCRQLPRVSIEGERFFLDERLHELRGVDDPLNRWTIKKA